ncbi:MAG: BamA/TamA family outer membrane protein [Leptospiraceae bacterium]|nr:BamA/TamA family outer membrane protein [Leptospiraceae bacterium]
MKFNTLNAILAAIILVLITVAFWQPLVSQEEQYIGQKITDIQFVGLRNVTTDEMYALITSRLGEPLKAELFNNDIKAIFQTGYFDRASMRLRSSADGVVIIFQVKERPRIAGIEFLGVDAIPVADLKAELEFRAGDVLDMQKVRSGQAAFKDKYFSDGFFLTEVWYKVGEINEDNERLVQYIIDEGAEIPVSKVNIIGARHLDPEDLADIIDTKEVGFLDDGVFDLNKFEEDKFKILAFAKTRGYLDAEIDPENTAYEIRWRNPSKPEEGRVVVVTFKLIENDIRFFGGYSIEHDSDRINLELNPPERRIKSKDDLTPVYRPADLLKFLEFNEDYVGEIFDESRFFKDRSFIHDQYARHGYVFAQVQPEFVNVTLTKENLQRYRQCALGQNPGGVDLAQCQKEARWLPLDELDQALSDNPELNGQTARHVHFTIGENNIAYIENIIIKGMQKTREYVIRRELLIKEGQLFNKSLVDRSREKLVNLQYFSEVNLQMRPGSSDDQMNLIIEVKEQPTGTISMGGGFGTQSGFSIFTELGENNLNGTGQRITGRLEYGPLRRSVSIDWTEPWFYEACEDNSGSFWRNKLKQAEEAESKEDIAALADSFINDYDEYRRLILSYAKRLDEKNSSEDMDLVKAQIRSLLFRQVAEEEYCYRTFPRPWSLSLGAFYQSSIFSDTSPLQISIDGNDLFEDASYERNRFGLRIGTQHSFLINWAHYHFYSPSWANTTRPTSLVNNAVLQEVDLGWQFKSSLRNGLIYSTLDNIASPTSGTQLNFEIELVGQYLGGEDHFNRYTASIKQYWWWFDYTFGGFFRSNNLRRWRVVQEFRFKGVFSHITGPAAGRSQDPEKNPYMELEDRQFLGGFPTLRGYDIADELYPTVWRDGANHMLIGGTELRVPIEPSILWLALFFDGGSLFDNIGEYNEDNRDIVDTYEQTQIAARLSANNPLLIWLADSRDISTGFLQNWHYESYYDWNNPKRAVLTQRNVAWDRALYSWGFGLRIQIPVLPLRLFMAQKLYYKDGNFKPVPGHEDFEFVFGIGDVRF